MQKKLFRCLRLSLRSILRTKRNYPHKIKLRTKSLIKSKDKRKNLIEKRKNNPKKKKEQIKQNLLLFNLITNTKVNQMNCSLRPKSSRPR